MTDFAYRITAEIEGFRRGFAEAQGVARQTSEGISREINRLGGTFDGLRGKILAITGVLAGGNFFRSAIDATVSMHVETARLAREFGITQDRALALRTAVNDMHVPLEVVSSAVNKLTVGLGDGGEKFEKLGIKVKDGNGQFLDMATIMANANARILQFKEGADRNAIAAQVYGKSWQEVIRILELTPSRLDAAIQKIKELGIELKPEAVEEYRGALNDANDVYEAMQVRIGMELLPTLTNLAKYFAEVGPTSTKVFTWALKHVIQFAEELVLAFRLAWNDLAIFGKQLGTFFDTLGAIALAAVSGQWRSIKDLWNAGTAEIEALDSKHLATYYRLNREHLNRVERLWSEHNEKLKVTKGPPTGGGSASGLLGNDEKKERRDNRPSRVPQWENELREFATVNAELARRQGQFYEQSTAQELQFWQGKLAMVQGGGKAEIAERTAVLKKIYDAKLAMFRQEYEAEIASYRAREAEAQNNAARRMAIAEQEAAAVAQRYGGNSKEYAQAEARVTQLKREAIAQRQQMEMIAAGVERDRMLASLDMAEADAKAQVQLKTMSNAQLLALQEQFEAQRVEIRRRYAQMEREMVDPEKDPVRYQELTAQIQQIEMGHQARLGEIRRQAAVQMQNDGSAQVWSSMSQSFGEAVDAMIFKGQTLRQSLQNIFRQVFQTFMQEMVTKPLMAAAIRAVKETALYQSLFGAQVATQTAASAQIVGTKAAEATAVVSANAAEGASGAAASQAAIPFVGPVLAIAAFAAIMALILGAGSKIKSAAGGYDIPSGTNPVTQLHEQEMVLPRAEANAVREMARGKRSGQSESSVVVVNNFLVGDEVTERSQQQIARDAGLAISSAMNRIG